LNQIELQQSFDSKKKLILTDEVKMDHNTAVYTFSREFLNEHCKVVFRHLKVTSGHIRIPDIIVVDENYFVKAIEIETSARNFLAKFASSYKDDNLYDEIIHVLIRDERALRWLKERGQTLENLMEYAHLRRKLRVQRASLNINLSEIYKLQVIIKSDQNLLKERESRTYKILKNLTIIKSVGDLNSPRSLAAIWRLYFYLNVSTAELSKMLRYNEQKIKNIIATLFGEIVWGKEISLL